jgi:TIR domain
MLLSKDVVAIERDFVNVLEHIPGTKPEKQGYFRSRGIRVPRTNYDAMWRVLSERLHHSGAAQSVFEYLQVNMPERLKELLRTASRDKAVELRMNEPAIVWDFFFQNGRLRRVGELFLEHRPPNAARTRRPATPVAPVHRGMPYEIAFSFAGEDRPFVETVAREVHRLGLKIFYDAFEQVDLLGKDLAAHFAAIYRQRARYCAMFISAHYVQKAWPQFERQHAQSRALAEQREYILPIRLDGSDVPGLPSTIGFLDARTMSPADVAAILFRKVRQ